MFRVWENVLSFDSLEVLRQTHPDRLEPPGATSSVKQRGVSHIHQSS